MLRRATNTREPSRLSREMNGSRLCEGGHGVDDQIEAAAVPVYLVGIFRHDHFLGGEPFVVGYLLGEGREQHRVGPEGVGELEAHVPELGMLAVGRRDSAVFAANAGTDGVGSFRAGDAAAVVCSFLASRLIWSQTTATATGLLSG